MPETDVAAAAKPASALSETRAPEGNLVAALPSASNSPVTPAPTLEAPDTGRQKIIPITTAYRQAEPTGPTAASGLIAAAPPLATSDTLAGARALDKLRRRLVEIAVDQEFAQEMKRMLARSPEPI